MRSETAQETLLPELLASVTITDSRIFMNLLDNYKVLGFVLHKN